MEPYELIHSPLCRVVKSGNHQVRVEIYRSEDSGWFLEVVDAFGNSTVWDDTFESDDDALAEFTRTLQEEGIGVLVGKPE